MEDLPDATYPLTTPAFVAALGSHTGIGEAVECRFLTAVGTLFLVGYEVMSAEGCRPTRSETGSTTSRWAGRRGVSHRCGIMQMQEGSLG